MRKLENKNIYLERKAKEKLIDSNKVEKERNSTLLNILKINKHQKNK